MRPLGELGQVCQGLAQPFPSFARSGRRGTDGTFSDDLSVMARLARIAVAIIPHHVTQRGNAR